MKTIFSLFLLFSTVAFSPIIHDNGYDNGHVATDFKLENIDNMHYIY